MSESKAHFEVGEREWDSETYAGNNVVLIGKARAGKDTVAGMLRVFDDKFERAAHADYLKKLVSIFLTDMYNNMGISEKRMTQDQMTHLMTKNKEWVRPFLQWFGTDFVRGFDDNYWVKALYTNTQDPTKRYVITDARFANEVDYQTVNGDAFVIRVIRPDVEIASSSHSSEVDADSIPSHIIIFNSGSPVDLFATVSEVYDKFLKEG